MANNNNPYRLLQMKPVSYFDVIGRRLIFVFCILLILNLYLTFNRETDFIKENIQKFVPNFLQKDEEIIISPKPMQVLQKFENRELLEHFDYRNHSEYFRVYVYDLPPCENREDTAVDQESAKFLYEWLKASSYATNKPEEACLFVFVLAEFHGGDIRQSLEHYRPNVSNHLIVVVNSSVSIKRSDKDIIYAASSLRKGEQLIHNMDLYVFVNVPNYDKLSWRSRKSILRKFNGKKKLVSFLTASNYGFSWWEAEFFHNCVDKHQSECDVQLICDESAQLYDRTRYPLCADSEKRKKLLDESMFTLILPDVSSNAQRFYEALRYGSIPMVVGDARLELPFGEFIDWSRATLQIPTRSLPKVVEIVQGISQIQRVEFLRVGQFYFDNFLGDAKVLTRAILSFFRFRLGMAAPIPSVHTFPSETLFTIEGNGTDTFSGITPLKANLFPICPNAKSVWNDNPAFLDATPMVSSVEFPLILEDVETNNDNKLYREFASLNKRKFPDFSRTLSGNRLVEKFTIVMLAYKRDEQLMFTLKSLNRLINLDAVVIVWNDVGRKPPVPSEWPHIHVPIHVVNATRNSLNNRFLPLDEIRTEAVFNMDNDFNVDHDDILFSFRVWRENRDRIVGPIFRLGFVKNGTGVYSTKQVCQYNMILTGGAFIHRSYLRTYTNQIPEVIQERIDELMNCEDIAINFLISHLTRKAPLKTTPIVKTIGKFASGGLSQRKSHYDERAECVKFFVDVFGYNPLVISEFRADSLLYNMFGSQQTKQNDENKCFKNT